MKSRFLSLCTSPILSLIFRVFLGALFLYSGIVKIADPLGFALSIYNYKLLPESLINVAAILLPWLEVIVGGSLLLGIGTGGGALIATALFSIFACALTINLIRGLDIACGCFSTAANGGSINWFYLLRDLGLLLMSLQVLLFDQALFSVTRLQKK
jgi:uncharacterized membrane protein YphA (DoxX/SURF4 family)